MKLKTIELTFLVLLAASGIAYLMTAMRFYPDESLDFYINPGFFPVTLAVILLILCAVSMIQTLVKKQGEAEKFPIDNLSRIIVVISLTVVYIYIWDLEGNLYYLYTFIYFVLVSITLSWKKSNRKWKLVLITCLVSFVITLSIYLLFDLAFSINLS